jgi:hypothetical protein
MDKEELIQFVTSCVFGLCKLLDLPVPFRSDVVNYAIYQFKEFKLNKNGMIEKEEFAKWIKGSDEI